MLHVYCHIHIMIMYNYDKPQAPQHSLTKTKQASLSGPAHTAPDSLLVRFPPKQKHGNCSQHSLLNLFFKLQIHTRHIYTQVHAHTNAHMHTYLDMSAEKERKTHIYQPRLTRLLSVWLQLTPTSSHSIQTETNCLSHFLLITSTHHLHFIICFFLGYKVYMTIVILNELKISLYTF